MCWLGSEDFQDNSLNSGAVSPGMNGGLQKTKRPHSAAILHFWHCADPSQVARYRSFCLERQAHRGKVACPRSVGLLRISLNDLWHAAPISRCSVFPYSVEWVQINYFLLPCNLYCCYFSDTLVVIVGVLKFFCFLF